MTPEQFEEKLKSSIPQIAEVFNNAPFVSIVDVEGALKQRIFNQGLDSNDSKIGNYDDTKKQTFLTGLAKPRLTEKASKKIQKAEFLSTQKNGRIAGITYKKLRELNNLQTAFVDFQFTGDLKKSIVTGKEGDKATLNFNNENELKIANFLTTKYKKPIFQPTEIEKQEAKDKMLSYIREETQNIIATWH